MEPSEADALAAMGLPTSFTDGRLPDAFSSRKRKAAASSGSDDDSDSDDGAASTPAQRQSASAATAAAHVPREMMTGSDSDDSAPEEAPIPSRAAAASAGGDSNGTFSADAASLELAAAMKAAAAAAAQKKKNKKRGGKAAQAKRKRRRLALEARADESAAAAGSEGAAEAVAAVQPDGEIDTAKAAEYAASLAASSSAAAASTPAQAASATASVQANDAPRSKQQSHKQQQQVEGQTPPVKKKKNKMGKVQREKAAALALLESQARAHGTEVRYWAQRYALFSRWDEGCALDSTGWFSVTPEAIAQHHAERMRVDVVIDAFAGVGGNAIALARTCRHVIAIELDPGRLALARQNARVYGVEDQIEWVCGDALALLPGLRADAVLLSPPWGGTDYIAREWFDIDAHIQLNAGPGADEEITADGTKRPVPCRGFELFARARAVTANIAYVLPRNIRPEQLQELASVPERARSGHVLPPHLSALSPPLACEMEENRVGGKVKMITAYFGGLVQQQPPPDEMLEEQQAGDEGES